MKIKTDQTKLLFENPNGYGYFICSVEWMSRWRDYIHGRGPQPGIINNSFLKSKVLTNRKRYGYPDNDTDIGLYDKKDFYILSVKFWKFFYDLYDCNHIIIIKYYMIE